MSTLKHFVKSRKELFWDISKSALGNLSNCCYFRTSFGIWRYGRLPRAVPDYGC